MRRRDLIESAATGAATFVWYAMPDVVPSRAARGVVKTVLSGGLAAMSVAQVRRDKAEAAARTAISDDGGALDRVRALTSTEPALDGSVIGRVNDPKPLCARPGLLAVGAALVTVVVGGSLAAEWGIHRFGQRLGARGISWPHTRIGIVSGLAAGALAVGATALAEQAERAEQTERAG